LNPPTLILWEPENPLVVAQDAKLVEISTGRPLSLTIDEIIARAANDENPPVALFDMLIGPHGRVKISDKDLAAYMTEALNRTPADPYTASLVVSRRHGMAKLTVEEARALAKKGECTGKQIERCVTLFTGYRSADQLLDDILIEKPDMKTSAQEICASARYYSGVANSVVSGLEKNGKHLSYPTAKALAEGLGFKGARHRAFTLLALGKQVLNSNRIHAKLQEAVKGTSARSETLTLVLNQTGLSRADISERLKVTFKILKRWEQAGQIVSDKPIAEGIAQLIHVNGEDAAFISTIKEAFYPPVAPKNPPNISARTSFESKYGL
jgi:hypothetical protein